MLGGNLGSLLYGDVSVMLNIGEIPQYMSNYGEIHLNRGKIAHYMLIFCLFDLDLDF